MAKTINDKFEDLIADIETELGPSPLVIERDEKPDFVIISKKSFDELLEKAAKYDAASGATDIPPSEMSDALDILTRES